MNKLFKITRSFITFVGGVTLTLVAGLVSNIIGRTDTPHDSPLPKATDDGLFSEVFLPVAYADVPGDSPGTDTCSADGDGAGSSAMV